MCSGSTYPSTRFILERLEKTGCTETVCRIARLAVYLLSPKDGMSSDSGLWVVGADSLRHLMFPSARKSVLRMDLHHGNPQRLWAQEFKCRVEVPVATSGIAHAVATRSLFLSLDRSTTVRRRGKRRKKTYIGKI